MKWFRKAHCRECGQVAYSTVLLGQGLDHAYCLDCLHRAAAFGACCAEEYRTGRNFAGDETTGWEGVLTCTITRKDAPPAPQTRTEGGGSAPTSPG